MNGKTENVDSEAPSFERPSDLGIDLVPFLFIFGIAYTHYRPMIGWCCFLRGCTSYSPGDMPRLKIPKKPEEKACSSGGWSACAKRPQYIKVVANIVRRADVFD